MRVDCRHYLWNFSQSCAGNRAKNKYPRNISTENIFFQYDIYQSHLVLVQFVQRYLTQLF